MKGSRPLDGLVVLLVAASGVVVAGQLPGVGELPQVTLPAVRALWVTRTTLTSPAAIRAMVQSAARADFNTLLVQVRGRGDAYFAGGREPRATALARQSPAFDPLRTVLDEAHAAGLRVHAWVNTNLVASAVDLPVSPSHVVNRHPEWLMVPRELAGDLGRLDPRRRSYRDRLAAWTRAQLDRVEGLYLSPVPRAAADHTVAVVADLAARYPVDGVHLDYVRYPHEEFDYSRAALEEFRAEVVRGLPQRQRSVLEQRRGKTPLAYVDAFPVGWRAFRVARLNALVSRISREVRQRRPGVLVTAAVLPDPAEAAERRLQDWPGWLASGVLDAACPMAYATEAATFETQMALAHGAAAGRPLWAGIGAYRLPSSRTVEYIRMARRLGVAGIILFSYDSLAVPPGGPDDYLADVRRGAFAR